MVALFEPPIVGALAAAEEDNNDEEEDFDGIVLPAAVATETAAATGEGVFSNWRSAGVK